ncbi:hypothetical protein [Novosphingobium subterraneum]|uniref:Lipoprotein n=1 Tax=Novosphingobium subterraneum TaxID=48936 RepID=A0A0B9A909_9SPHN|nr:hypothetical protein [Novosphingobium subterraneum]KHS45847.1 hypothetical protein NJ75_02452 [Novosphingobium subterraneum]
MKVRFPMAALPFALASCAPTADQAVTDAVVACQRADVQDVLGKEVRNMMLKAAADRVLTAAFFGINMTQSLEQARTTFTEVGVYTGATPSGAPFKQIICGGTLQIDASTATSGQDIVTIPRLRWSVNFTQPTEEPGTAAFTVAVDPASIRDGLLVNGQAPAESGQRDTSSDEAGGASSAESSARSEADSAANDAADAGDAAADVAAAAREAAAASEAQPPSRRQPTEDELYAPHGN